VDEQEIMREKQQFELSQRGFAKELAPHEDQEDDKQGFTAEQRKEILRLFTEEPSFGNKRKQELERLLNTPVFTEAKIRFMLPDGSILESHFSPKERIKDLRDELEKVLVSKPRSSNPAKLGICIPLHHFKSLSLKDSAIRLWKS
jgi:hypothetical protein